jgi:iron complex outermembrane receptor protein
MSRNSSKALVSAIATILGTVGSNISAALADETLLKEIVVTASQGKNPMDVAQPTAVLSGDDLSRQLAGSLGETLSSQMGVNSSYFGPTASRPVIRGLGGYRVQTLLDGIASLDVGSLSDDHAVTVDPSLAEQLEILKGPATLLYGSGASGGLINVVTNRIPSRAPAGKVSGLGELRGDTAADERAGVFALNVGDEHFALHGDYFKSQSEAIDIPGATISNRLADELIAAGEPVDTHVGQIPNAFSDAQGGALGASWLGEQGMIGASVSRYENTYGIPSEEEAFIDMQQDRYDAKAEWRSNSGWLRSISLTGAYNDYTHTEFEAPGVPGTVFNQDAYEVRAAADHVHNDSWRGTFGAQLTNLDFVAQGEEAFVPASVTKSLGVFFLEEVDLKQWTLNAGARFEKQTIDAVTDLPQFDDTAFSFAAGAVLDLSSEDTLAINLTHTDRHPQATELFANGPHIAAQRFEIGDSALDTEVANTVDISLRRDSDGISWLFNVFYNDYDNFIFADPTGNITDGLNEVQYAQSPVTLYGYEAEIWMPVATGSSYGTWRVRLMSDYVRGERAGGEPLPQMPPLRLGAGVHFDQAAWHAEVEAIHNAEQDRLASNELATDSFVMLNADISYRLESANTNWLLYLRGTNLLDEEARQSTSSLKDVVPLPGRSLHAGVRVTF